MHEKKFRVEELMLDEGFVDYCLNEDSAYRPYWELVIESNPDQRSVFERAANNILLLSGNLSEKEILQQIEKVRSHLKEGKYIVEASNVIGPADDHQQKSSTDTTRAIFLRRNFIYAAAVIVVFCIGIYVLFPQLIKKQSREVAIPETVYSSKPGERKKIELQDGSVVILNTNSSIHIKSDFNNTIREVDLTGEAFFHVAKNPSKPFIVKSNNLSTTALGTSFYIQARNANENYTVDLLEGKVKLSGNVKKSITLFPGEEANWNKANEQFAKTSFDTTELEQWLTGKISLSKTSLDSAIGILEKWYAVDVEIKNKSIIQKSITGEYDNMPLDDVLKVICFSLSCKYTYVNNNVIIE